MGLFRKTVHEYNYVDMRKLDEAVAADTEAPVEKISDFDPRDYLREPTYELGGFDNAIAHLKMGYQVTRAGWNGAGQFLELQVPDSHSKMSLPYIFITTVQGDRVPWLASQTDLLANDWRSIR